MPSVEDNQSYWNKDYEWSERGAEWSKPWGGAEPQWFFSVFPRIHSFIPTGTILEIAPGFGRWSHFLKDNCRQLILVDLAEKCIGFCKERFSTEDHIAYHVNDGQSLDMIKDGSIDFVFSFDSLVHADAEVLRGYLKQLHQKLKPNGAGFIHHSNLASYPEICSIPSTQRSNYGFCDHWRGEVSATLFEEICKESSLQCIAQELVNWNGEKFAEEDVLLDAFSLFTKESSSLARPNQIAYNENFMREAEHIKSLSRLYCTSTE